MSSDWFSRYSWIERNKVLTIKFRESMGFEAYNDAPSLGLCNGNFTSISKLSLLEALPIELLVKVLCGVDHEDLNQLFNVSKKIREGTKIAKKLHFEYSTPRKKTCAFHTSIDIEHVNGFEDIEAPNAPMRKYRPPLNGKNLFAISKALFVTMEKEQ